MACGLLPELTALIGAYVGDGESHDPNGVNDRSDNDDDDDADNAE